MALNGGYETLHTLGLGRVLVHGHFRPNGVTGVVSGSDAGQGYSVARTSAGLYTVTFDNKWPDLVSAWANVRAASAAGTFATIGDYVAASKTLQIRVWQGSSGSLTEQKGFVPLDLFGAREIASNAIQDLAGVGGMLASDSVPALERINGATDKAIRIAWAASEQDEIQFAPVAKPADMDASSDVTVHLMVSKDANTDAAAVIDVQAWDGIGDTEMGGNTAALDGAALAEYSVTLANANIAAAPGFLNVGIVPGAHANDAVYLHGAWLEYTKTATTTDAESYALTDLSADADNEVTFGCVFRNTSVNY